MFKSVHGGLWSSRSGHKDTFYFLFSCSFIFFPSKPLLVSHKRTFGVDKEDFLNLRWAACVQSKKSLVRSNPSVSLPSLIYFSTPGFSMGASWMTEWTLTFAKPVHTCCFNPSDLMNASDLALTGAQRKLLIKCFPLWSKKRFPKTQNKIKMQFQTSFQHQFFTMYLWKKKTFVCLGLNFWWIANLTALHL